MFRILTKQIIRSDDGAPYLVRRSLKTPLGDVKLHHILRSDDDRDLHDHPWSFLSIILWGGYWEHTPFRLPGGILPLDIRLRLNKDSAGRFNLRTWYGVGRVLWRPVPSTHRLELPPGRTAWTLVFTGPKRREWGFHTICGFIPWMKYTQAKEEGC